jgi:folate-dependent phosphoribosylglycinamide formyltransferase PurN
MRLLNASMATAAARDDIEVVAVIDAARQPGSRLRLPRALTTWGLRSVFNPSTATDPSRRPPVADCRSIARRRQVPALVPRDRSVNDSSFVETVRRLQPDATVALMVGQLFRSPLLDACRIPINYHDGLLPHYRGVAATGWSIYDGVQRSGFSFHRMIEQIDRGPIVLQGTVPVGPNDDATRVESAKARAAARELNSVFDMLVSSDHGLEQSDPGSSFTRADLQAIRAVEHPEQLTEDELLLRLRAFGTIELTLAGRPWSTTALRRIGRRPHNRRLAFTTADGVRLEPRRLRHLPPAVYCSLAAGVGVGVLGSELWPS